MERDMLKSLFVSWLVSVFAGGLASAEVTLEEIDAAMKKAARFYREEVAVNGGYVYYYSPDLSKRLGEGVASKTQIWVQNPGTPTVGMAFLEAWKVRISKVLNPMLSFVNCLFRSRVTERFW